MPEPSSDARRIIAVVVTFNRRDMVTRLVAALDAGTVVPDEVVVVDNASTDGTADALEAADTKAPLTVLRLPENTGGAGGFHTGLAEAMDRGADLAWLMDDDGTPAADCLAVPAPAPGHARLHRTGGRRRGRPGPAVLPDPGPRELEGAARRRRPRSRRVLGAVPGAPRRRGDPVQRGAGHPRAGGADRPAARGVLHLGRRRRVPLACRGQRAPGSPRSSAPGSGTRRPTTSVRR